MSTEQSLPPHNGYIQHHISGKRHFAVCRSCGWMGYDRATEAEAEAELIAHSEASVRCV